MHRKCTVLKGEASTLREKGPLHLKSKAKPVVIPTPETMNRRNKHLAEATEEVLKTRLTTSPTTNLVGTL